jgi:hypothetical protein
VVACNLSKDFVLMEMTFDDVEAAFNAYQYSQRSSWEQARLMAFYAVAPSLEKGTTIEKFLPLAWDKKQKAPPQMSEEHIDKLLKDRGLKRRTYG